MSSNHRIRLRLLRIAIVTAIVLLMVGVVIWAAFTLSPQQDRPTGTTASVATAGPEDVVCGEYSRFSGEYVEDGQGQPVQYVAAMLVTNQSDAFLDLATLTYLIDGKEATFVVTGLPPKTSAWVMEKNRMTIGENAVFQRKDCSAAFREHGGFTGEISLLADGHNLTAINETDKTLKNVYVYYKVLHSDGNFFGGITYRVGFGDLAPDAAVEKIAGHYTKDGAQVVRITWQDE